jgi:tRNA pseudouridine32 synthase/23S rRNA pseudouridine746 synthase
MKRPPMRAFFFDLCFMFIPLGSEFQHLALPERFTFPFYYDVHPIAKHAVALLQQRLNTEDFGHDFGLGRKERMGAIGKMFGVLVVQNSNRELGYLAAFSGKLGNSNHHVGFVPPVFDILEAQGFFRREEVEIHELTIQLEQLEGSKELDNLKVAYQEFQAQWANQLEEQRLKNKSSKSIRDIKRSEALVQDPQNISVLESQLREESMHESRRLKALKKQAQEDLSARSEKLRLFKEEIEQLKAKRAAQSADVQQRIFERYTFLNALGQTQNVLNLFTELPPAGAGECAAPKLLQYAYLNQLQPICMAEFWWGMSPDSEVRIHGHFYPSCKSKCEPILGHMLQGLDVDPNPIAAIHPPKALDIIYEDDYIVAINKAPEYLSVPGKNPQPNSLEDLKKYFPEADGPLLVHRLDMSTSGIMLAAKTKLMHQRLQRQFVLRKVEKQYIAVLAGIPTQMQGEIKLPLRVDLDDRPRQLVCEEHGSYAHTTYEVLEIVNGETRIRLFPKTGRTHQLRVHSAHHLGLNCPIKGDDLYGQKADRLHLHAAKLGFYHPYTNEWMELNCQPDF